ncbi:unnamed protein product [Protopolystoma xenopodis]|uniref:Secreted protein n=1 Tax=Protopolystoma xenopodis TaxID=117903 RepID=A0A3S5AEY4_9PLAT|nr:unnamed protein product [Protopolystoma xenopodis]
MPLRLLVCLAGLLAFADPTVGRHSCRQDSSSYFCCFFFLQLPFAWRFLFSLGQRGSDQGLDQIKDPSRNDSSSPLLFVVGVFTSRRFVNFPLIHRHPVRWFECLAFKSI